MGLGKGKIAGMGVPKYRTIFWRACRATGRIVVASSPRDWAIKTLTTAFTIAALYTFTQFTPRNDETLFDDRVAIGLVAIAVAAALVLAVFLAQLLFVAPFQLWREEWKRAEGAEGELANARDAGPKPIKDRVSLTSGLMRSLFGDWDHTVSDLTGEDQVTLLGSRVREFKQLAHDRVLTIWGTRERHGVVHEKLDPAVWIQQQIDWFSMIEGAPHTVMNLNVFPPDRLPPYFDLLVSKAEIERLFPAGA